MHLSIDTHQFLKSTFTLNFPKFYSSLKRYVVPWTLQLLALHLYTKEIQALHSLMMLNDG